LEENLSKKTAWLRAAITIPRGAVAAYPDDLQQENHRVVRKTPEIAEKACSITSQI